MSKVGNLLQIIEGTHVMGTDGLRDYHAAKKAISAARCRTPEAKLATVQTALKNHRVTVSERYGDVAVTRYDTECPKSWYLNH